MTLRGFRADFIKSIWIEHPRTAMVIKFIGRYKLSEKIVLLSNKDLTNFEKPQAVNKLDKRPALAHERGQEY